MWGFKWKCPLKLVNCIAADTSRMLMISQCSIRSENLYFIIEFNLKDDDIKHNISAWKKYLEKQNESFNEVNKQGDMHVAMQQLEVKTFLFSYLL